MTAFSTVTKKKYQRELCPSFRIGYWIGYIIPFHMKLQRIHAHRWTASVKTLLCRLGVSSFCTSDQDECHSAGRYVCLCSLCMDVGYTYCFRLHLCYWSNSSLSHLIILVFVSLPCSPFQNTHNNSRLCDLNSIHLLLLSDKMHLIISWKLCGLLNSVNIKQPRTIWYVGYRWFFFRRLDILFKIIHISDSIIVALLTLFFGINK